MPIAATDYLKCPFNLKSPAGSDGLEDCVRDKQKGDSSRRLLSVMSDLTQDSDGFTTGAALAGAAAMVVVAFLLYAAFSSFNASKVATSSSNVKNAKGEKIEMTHRLPLSNPREMDGFYGDSAFDGGATPTATPVV